MRKSKNSGSVLLLNGPNLNLLGTREPHLYGRETLPQIERRLAARAKAAGVKLERLQTNHEGVAVDRVQQAHRDGVAFIILNPAAFTYSSIALRDALTGVQIPFIEVHLSNIHAREPWRAHSHFTAVAVGSILGLGSHGYDLALEYAIARLKAGGGA
ncbi:MAG: type II 3-dehydroquinate dehydratase [Betaproteobacteria bacterium]|nr:type II 3-dehydroquinate dehydratase [Betaproteobacteria bacterium]